jgi:hypothetical protein
MIDQRHDILGILPPYMLQQIAQRGTVLAEFVIRAVIGNNRLAVNRCAG